MTPEQLMEWFTFQYALILSGHHILLEPLLDAPSATYVRSHGPAVGDDAPIHELHPLGPARARMEGVQTIVECDVDDRWWVDSVGAVTAKSRRLRITFEVHLGIDEITRVAIGPPGADAAGDRVPSLPVHPVNPLAAGADQAETEA